MTSFTGDTPPSCLQPDFNKLKRLCIAKDPRWLMWSLKKNEAGKWTKPPMSINNRRGSSTNPETWTSYEDAKTAYQFGNFAGVGYALGASADQSDGDQLIFIDMDGARDPVTGVFEDWADELLQESLTYAEISPTKTGAHILAYGKLPKGFKSVRTDHIEIYNDGRYMTMTGAHISSSAADIYEDQDTIDRAIELAKEFGAKKAAPVELTPVDDDTDFPMFAWSLLSPDLQGLVRLGVPDHEDRSKAFHHAICWMKDAGLSIGQVIRVLHEYPEGIARKYLEGGRSDLDVRAQESFARAEDKAERTPGAGPPAANAVDAAVLSELDALFADSDKGWFNAEELKGDAPEREWVAKDWIPKNAVTALYGDGGTGKTLIAQQLAYARHFDQPWLGIQIQPGKTFCVFCEDDRDELHRRHDAIRQHYGGPLPGAVNSVTLWPRVGSDNLLVTFDHNQQPRVAPFFLEVLKGVRETGSDVLILDTAADLFGGNEVIRKEVNYFLKAICGRFVRAQRSEGKNLSVLILAHPSLSGMASGTGTGGSTAWNNGVRSRTYLTRPEEGLDEQRILTRKKANYSASGDGTATELWWEEGVLVRAQDSTNAVDRMEAQKAERRIKELVKAAWDGGTPYKGRRDNEFFLDRCVIEILEGEGIKRQIIGRALKRLKDSEMIRLKNGHRQRGYTLIGEDDDE